MRPAVAATPYLPGRRLPGANRFGHQAPRVVALQPEEECWATHYR